MSSVLRQRPLLGARAADPDRDELQPVGLTPDDVAGFQRLLLEDSGVDLDEPEAAHCASELVMLYRILLGPIPEDSEIPADSDGSNFRALARLELGKVS